MTKVDMGPDWDPSMDAPDDVEHEDADDCGGCRCRTGSDPHADLCRHCTGDCGCCEHGDRHHTANAGEMVCADCGALLPEDEAERREREDAERPVPESDGQTYLYCLGCEGYVNSSEWAAHEANACPALHGRRT